VAPESEPPLSQPSLSGSDTDRLAVLDRVANTFEVLKPFDALDDIDALQCLDDFADDAFDALDTFDAFDAFDAFNAFGVFDLGNAGPLTGVRSFGFFSREGWLRGLMKRFRFFVDFSKNTHDQQKKSILLNSTVLDCLMFTLNAPTNKNQLPVDQECQYGSVMFDHFWS
jgi:hypothetical protein